MSMISFGQADTLSRLINSNRTPDKDRIHVAVSYLAEVKRVMSDASDALPVIANMVQNFTLSD